LNASPSPSTTTVAEFRDVVVRYGTFTALEGVTFSIRPGATGLVGRNGAGKSTLLRLMLGLVRPTSGEGSILGFDLAAVGAELRQSVGYMPENDALVVGMNGLEQVVLAGELCGLSQREAARRAHESLAYTDLGEARYRPVDAYSAGMRQRLKLAVAIVHDPRLLLLDEPTVGLDPPGRRRMLALIKDLVVRHKKSLILCTHLLGDVEACCENLALLEAGRVIGDGPIAAMKRTTANGLRVSWEGSRSSFLDRLAKEGVRVGAVHDASAGDDLGFHRAAFLLPIGYDARGFFAAAHETNSRIWKLEPDEEGLSDLYHRLLGAKGSALSRDG
jgi:ABC-2 type transport system ATP-binding protein